MIVFNENNVINITLAEITCQGFKSSGWGTVIKSYTKGDEKIYWHSQKEVFFKNATVNAEPERPFRVIVAGSRTFKDYEFMKRKLDIILSNKTNIEIVSGTQRTRNPHGEDYGADYLGEKYAAEKGYAVKRFPADWDGLGRKAGHVRNEEMAVYAAPDGGCIVFRENNSPGSTSMINYATQYGLKLKVYDLSTY